MKLIIEVDISPSGLIDSLTWKVKDMENFLRLTSEDGKILITEAKEELTKEQTNEQA